MCFDVVNNIWLFLSTIFYVFLGFAHFLRGNQYWKFDPVEVKVLEGYPRFTGMDFFGCSAALYR